MKVESSRRDFMKLALATGACGAFAGCATGKTSSSAPEGKRILFGACTSPDKAPLLKAAGFDFYEWGCGSAFVPEKGEEAWKKNRDIIQNAVLPLRSCNGFLPGKFRLTGPQADHAPALKYAETVMRRAAEVGVKTLVFGSGGARNVPGDYLGKTKPDVEKGVEQYTAFCQELCRRTSDLEGVTLVIEPLRPNESNIINFVWQGVQICREVGSPRLNQLADIFHMMMGRESADSIVQAGCLMRHCHIASYGTRLFPGSDPATVDRFRPYIAALRRIGYTGGVSCECGWGKKEDFEKNLATAIAALRSL